MIPMLAHTGDLATNQRLLADDEWWAEPKLDGERRMVRVTPTRITGLSKQGTTASLSKSVAGQFASFEATFVLDGELVGDTLHVFDMPCGFGVDRAPYSRRREALEHLFTLGRTELGWDDTALRLVPRYHGDDKALLWAAVLANNGEGLIFKKSSSLYQPGTRSRQWIKWKNTHPVTCIAVGFNVNGKQNIALAMLDENGNEVPVGEVSRLTGDGPRVKLRSVIDVTALYSTDSNRLYQPVKARLRPDLTERDATINQLDLIRPGKVNA